MKKKLIAWESWNQKEIEDLEDDFDDFVEEIKEIDELPDGMPFLPQGSLLELQPQIIHTPFGPVDPSSKLKPSDRWDCWMGYTNFEITHGISDQIKKLEGIEALKVLSRYTFCVGVGKLFQFRDVRKSIENAICK